MSTEVIIAARGEIPANLNRTVAQAQEVADVCVVFDGSEKGNDTPPHLKCRIERPWDGKNPRGPGQARHHGIKTSKADIIVVTDGHMQFRDGWMDAIEGHLAKHRKHVTCTSTENLQPNWSPIGDPIHHGAFLAVKTTEPQVDCHGPAREYFGLSAKWTPHNKPDAVIPAPMGACYGFTKDWYKKMGEPFTDIDMSHTIF